MSALQRTPEWLESRHGMVTGSRVGAILGQNPYKSADDVLREMVREVHELESETVVTPAMQYGIAREHAIKQRLAWEHGIEGHDAGFVLHPAIAWIGVSPDWTSPGVEIKASTGKRYTLADKPDHEAQCRLCMECLDVDSWLYVVEYADDVPLHIETVKRDPDWMAQVLPALADFMRRYEEAIKDPTEHLEPKVQEREDDTWLRLAHEYRAAKVESDQAIQRLADARRMLEELASGRSCQGGGVRVTQVKGRGSVDMRALEAAGVDVERYRKPGKASVRVTLEG